MCFTAKQRWRKVRTATKQHKIPLSFFTTDAIITSSSEGNNGPIPFLLKCFSFDNGLPTPAMAHTPMRRVVSEGHVVAPRSLFSATPTAAPAIPAPKRRVSFKLEVRVILIPLARELHVKERGDIWYSRCELDHFRRGWMDAEEEEAVTAEEVSVVDWPSKDTPSSPPSQSPEVDDSLVVISRCDKVWNLVQQSTAAEATTVC